MFYRKIISTADGSATILIPEWDESYHSRHGAVREAFHVFIRNGLDLIPDQKEEISVLEIGFGTGLNALITLYESIRRNQNIHYIGIEKYPVSETEFSALNYSQSLKEFDPSLIPDQKEAENYYKALMNAGWEITHPLNPGFCLHKIQADFLEYDYPAQKFNLIYFDAFGARVQPELWTEILFDKLYKALVPGGIFTTYSAKGSVRRALAAVGFSVEKRPGPPGKREMLVAFKR